MPEERDAEAKKLATRKNLKNPEPQGGSAAKKTATGSHAGADGGDTARTPAKKRPATKASGKRRPEIEGPEAPNEPAIEATAGPAGESPAAESPAAESPAGENPAGENPLHKKLGLRPGISGAVIGAPADDDDPLAPLPEGLTVLAGIEEVSTLTGPYDYMHVFARDRGDLAAAFDGMRDKLAPGGSLWVSWMKQSSDRRARGTFTDLNETVIRRIALTHGMIDVKVVALDRDWAALRLVRRKH
ncbi:MAG: hypothetical protein LLG45_11060 [Actinomycetia bacterium]|nr:hypothetical protein [Actinomycetes bacterium]